MILVKHAESRLRESRKVRLLAAPECSITAAIALKTFATIAWVRDIVATTRKRINMSQAETRRLDDEKMAFA